MRLFAESVLPEIAETRTSWLVPPDATTLRGIAAWTQEPTTLPKSATALVCVVNYDLTRDSGYFGLPGLPPDAVLVPRFSTLGDEQLPAEPVRHNGFFHRVDSIAPGEGRAYAIDRQAG